MEDSRMRTNVIGDIPLEWVLERPWVWKASVIGVMLAMTVLAAYVSLPQASSPWEWLLGK